MVDNSKEAILRWMENVLSNSPITKEEHAMLLEAGKKIMDTDGWRGDICDGWRMRGFGPGKIIGGIW